MKIGIISAMDSEHALLAERLQEAGQQETEGWLFPYLTGKIGSNQAVLARCGIGKVNAAIGAAELIRREAPDCIISTGVAGGTGDDLQVMDVVAGARVVYHDVWCGDGNAYGQIQGLPAVFEAHPALVDCARRLATSGTESRVRCGLICTGDQFITDRERLDEIKGHFPEVQAVDMESAAIAQTCHLYGIPFISFRIVSDTPGVEEHWQQYENFWGTMAQRSFQTTWQFLTALPGRLS